MEGFAKQCVTEQWQGSMTLTYDMNKFFIFYFLRRSKRKIWDESCSENSEYFYNYGNNVLASTDSRYWIWFLGVLFTGQNISRVHHYQPARIRKDALIKNRIICITSMWFKNIMLQSLWWRPFNQQTNLFSFYLSRALINLNESFNWKRQTS